MAQTALLGGRNYADVGYYTPALSGGGWRAGYGLTNLQDPRSQRPARSTDATTGNTQFDIDYGIGRSPRIRSLPWHNLTTAAQVRVRSSNVAGDFSAPVYDAGWVDVWPVVYPANLLPLGHLSYATLKISVEDAIGYPIGFTLATAAGAAARYERWEVSDAANPAGYIELGRLFVGPAWQCSVGTDQGAQLGYGTSTVRSEADGGAALFDLRTGRRSAVFSFADLPVNEALTQPFTIQRLLGTGAQAFFVMDPSDTIHLHRRAFLCSLRQLELMSLQGDLRYKAAFAVDEEL